MYIALYIEILTYYVIVWHFLSIMIFEKIALIIDFYVVFVFFCHCVAWLEWFGCEMMAKVLRLLISVCRLIMFLKLVKIKLTILAFFR